MPVSSIIKKYCKEKGCNKLLVEDSRSDFCGSLIITYTCGHCEIVDKADLELENKDDYNFTSLTKKYKPRPYQIEGIKFAEASNFRAIIADEQGLGKTIQGLGCVKLHRTKLTPGLVVTKTTIKHQWFWEFKEWAFNEGFLIQVINSSKEKALPGFDFYITSFDLVKAEGMFDLLVEPEHKLKLLIIDECQAIKNHLSDRAKAVQRISEGIPHVLALSGTPIKNNAGEYFTILNIVQPSRFPSYKNYLDNYCDYYETQYGPKIGGLANPERFRADTKDFIIRRTRKEAAPEIPEVNRTFQHVELDRKLNKAYATALQELDDIFYADETADTMTSMIAIMTKMRKITGISKTAFCTEYVTEFLLNTDRKIVIFAHHHDAVSILEEKLNSYLKDGGFSKVLNLNANLDGSKRQELVNRFRDDDSSRVMIASTLAAGEGLNLQFCSDAIMLERQWNPANEEQAEGRFARLGRKNEAEPINVVYMLASETIDEYFTDLVEQKRAIVKSTMDNELIQWDQNSLVKELASILVTKGKKKFSL